MAEQPNINESGSPELARVKDEVSPDSLMRDFRGHKLLLLVVVAIVVHAVLFLGSSLGFIRKELFGTDTSEMSKEDRVKVALGEATSALGEIVERHNLTVDDLTERFASAGSRASQVQSDVGTADGGSADKPEDAPAETPAAAPPQPDVTEFEKNLPQATVGPDSPMTDDEDMTGL